MKKKLVTFITMVSVVFTTSYVAPVTAQAAKTKAWYKAYTKQISKIYSSGVSDEFGVDLMGSYLYLNNDNVPELYIVSSDNYQYLLSYSKGKLKVHKWFGITDDIGLKYRKKKNYFEIDLGSPNGMNDSNEIKKLKDDGSCKDLGFSATYSDGSSECKWGEKKVSKKTFKSKERKLLKGAKAIFGLRSMTELKADILEIAQR